MFLLGSGLTTAAIWNYTTLIYVGEVEKEKIWLANPSSEQHRSLRILFIMKIQSNTVA